MSKPDLAASIRRSALKFITIGQDFARDTVSRESFGPSDLLRTALRVAATSAEALGGLPREMNGAQWQEAANKLEVCELFVNAGGLKSMELAQSVQRCQSLEPFSRPWVLEGVGYDYAGQALGRGRPCDKLLQGPHTTGIPHSLLLTLHTGAGMAFGRAALAERSRGTGTMLQRHWQRCLDNAEGPWAAEIMFESLGFVAATLNRELIPEIRRELDGWPAELVDSFWHGVGRGMYFLPSNLAPISAMRRYVIVESRRMAPEGAGRKKVFAGIAWAVTLTNLRHPAVLASWVEEQDDEAAFRSGVASALKFWLLCVPEDQHVARLSSYRPHGNSRLTTLWDSIVSSSCDEARVWSAAPEAAQSAATLFRAG